MFYENGLNEFEKKVNNPNTIESELRDELKNKIWIIDFKYQNINQFKHEKEVPITNGRIDLWVSRSKTQKKKDIIIELKLAEDAKTRTIVKHRGRDAIGSSVGRALSQLVNYMESNDLKESDIREGLVIIGRKSEDSFLELFNKYLHGIQIRTYKQLIDDCRAIIESFKIARTMEEK